VYPRVKKKSEKLNFYGHLFKGKFLILAPEETSLDQKIPVFGKSQCSAKFLLMINMGR
jgi:hypothetical protein